jgi:hypothetical protein
VSVILPKGLDVKLFCGQVFQHLTNYFPIGRTEIHAKWLTTGQKERVDNDIRESPHDVWVQFDLAEGRLCHWHGG